MMGLFNIYNLTSAISACHILTKKPLQDICKKVENFGGVSGRLEIIKTNPLIIVDFAHTPDGLKNSLSTLKNHYPQHNLTVVFGCGGNRDKEKRAKMGKIAGEIADRIILTNDNPRDENPEDIINDIIIGTNKELQIITDRALAIEAGISNITPEDGVKIRRSGIIKILAKNECVLIAGKGSENYQIIKGEKIPFNDEEVINNIL
jgi:UDP-N-acetylmuramoyl-L-alanyl-D-glutamate--2,6-diaminopimelate ligase